jgi:uncharacterized repeat protein (TIGR03803 family)
MRTVLMTTAALAIASLGALPPAAAQRAPIAYTFPEEVTPQGSLLFQHGKFYGASTDGLSFSLKPPPTASGTWTYTQYGNSGYAANPASGVAVDPAGVIYTADTDNGYYPAQIVAQTAATPSGPGLTTTLYTSPANIDTQMYGPLIRDGAGVLYGSFPGWTSGLGVVYSLTPPAAGQTAWTFAALHIFSGPDGSGPYSGVVHAPNGTFIGTTETGGRHGKGTVFALTPPQTAGGLWTEQVLYSFAGPANNDGATPISGVAVDQTGAIYGTTHTGRTGGGGGTLYKLTPPSGGSGAWAEQILTDEIYQPLYAPTLAPHGIIYAVGSDSSAVTLTPDPAHAGQYSVTTTPVPEFANSGITLAGSYEVGASGCQGCYPGVTGTLWYLP